MNYGAHYQSISSSLFYEAGFLINVILIFFQGCYSPPPARYALVIFQVCKVKFISESFSFCMLLSPLVLQQHSVTIHLFSSRECTYRRVSAVNNAGTINRNNKLWEVPAEEFDAVIDTNLKGIANILRHFIPLMVESKQGVVVNMSSGWGRSVAAEVKYKINLNFVFIIRFVTIDVICLIFFSSRFLPVSVELKQFNNVPTWSW